MHFAQILSDCIEALAQGSSVEQCLARHPDHAEALAPLLRLVASLPDQSKPRLSARAFQEGRAALAAAAQATQRTRGGSMRGDSPLVDSNAPSEHHAHRHFAPYRDLLEQAGARAGHPNGLPPAGTPQRRGRTHDRTHRHPPTLPTGRHHRFQSAARVKGAAVSTRLANRTRLRQVSAVLLALLLMFSGALVLRQTAVSTPGAPLYALKTISEQGQGLLMTAAGEGATWHANQMLRRVAELGQMAGTDAQVAAATQAVLAPTLVARATAHADQALTAGARLSQTDQRTFLLNWLTELERTKQTLQQAPTPSQEALALLDETVAQVATAMTALDDAAIEVLDEVLATASPEASDAPTVLPTATAPAMATARTERITDPLNQQPTPTRVLQATAIPTATPVLEQLQPSLATAIARPTATALPAATPLPVMTQVIPLESQRRDQAEGGPSSDSSPPPFTATREADRDRDDEPTTTDNEPDEARSDDAERLEPDNEPAVDGDGASDPGATPGPTLSIWTPTPSSGEGVAATATAASPTPMSPVPELTLQPLVEPDATIAVPAPPTAPDDQDQPTSTTVAPEQTTVGSEATPVSVEETAQPPATVAPTPEEKRTRERQPTRTRRPTATPAPTSNATSVAEPTASALP
jgi:hypothetical protein